MVRLIDDIGRIIGKPRRKPGSQNNADGLKKCPECGNQSTRGSTCAACSDQGKELAKKIEMYESDEFDPKSPIIDDIYSALGTKGEMSFAGLGKEINVRKELAEVYASKLAEDRGTIAVYPKHTDHGVKMFCRLTRKGEKLSKAFQVVTEHEKLYGHLPTTDVRTPEKPKSSRGRKKSKGQRRKAG